MKSLPERRDPAKKGIRQIDGLTPLARLPIVKPRGNARHLLGAPVFVERPADTDEPISDQELVAQMVDRLPIGLARLLDRPLLVAAHRDH
jgi:hypothetical protein